MSWRLQPRGKAGSPHFSDGRLARSSAEVVADALQRLRVTPAGLHAWTEQLRLWLAADLLQPLMRLLDAAHAVSVRTDPPMRPMLGKLKACWAARVWCLACQMLFIGRWVCRVWPSVPRSWNLHLHWRPSAPRRALRPGPTPVLPARDCLWSLCCLWRVTCQLGAQEVARHAAQLGLAVALAPVGAEAGAAARAGAGAASSAAAETDDDVLAAQLRAQLTNALRGPAHAHTAAAFACLEVCAFACRDIVTLTQE